MSIIIKGLDMPSNGAERCIVIRSDGTVRTFVGAEIPATAEQLPPHGRLIDADALIVDLMDRGVEGLQTDDWHEVQQAVEDAPTIIEAEGEDGEDEL